MDFIQMVDEEIDRMTGMISAYPNLCSMISYHMEKRGSRLLIVIANEFCEAFGISKASAAKPVAWLEVFHNFTLIHDDIIDRDEVRRGQASVWKKWNKDKAILAGDALLSLVALHRESFGESMDEAEIREFILTVIEGEFYDVLYEERLSVGIDECIEMLRMKSGRTIAFLLNALGRAAGLDDETTKAFSLIGEHAGISLQIKNDIWNVIETFEKGAGGDIGRRKKTLPILFGLRNAGGGKDSPEQEGCMLRYGADAAETAKRMIENGGAACALKKAEEYNEKAVRILEGLPPHAISEDKKRELISRIRQDFNIYAGISAKLHGLPLPVDERI